jgi:hypothetical protein
MSDLGDNVVTQNPQDGGAATGISVPVALPAPRPNGGGKNNGRYV